MCGIIVIFSYVFMSCAQIQPMLNKNLWNKIPWVHSIYYHPKYTLVVAAPHWGHLLSRYDRELPICIRLQVRHSFIMSAGAAWEKKVLKVLYYSRINIIHFEVEKKVLKVLWICVFWSEFSQVALNTIKTIEHILLLVWY